jgi:hypothetical protein
MVDQDDAEDELRGGMSAALARAEAAVAALARDYLVWAKADLEASYRHLAAAREDPAQRPQHIAALFSVAHNIKGQGSSFGYPLMTRVGQSLCRLTRLPLTFGQSDLALIEAHLQLMSEIITQQATGDGTATLRTNVTQMELLVDALGTAA